MEDTRLIGLLLPHRDCLAFVSIEHNWRSCKVCSCYKLLTSFYLYSFFELSGDQSVVVVNELWVTWMDRMLLPTAVTPLIGRFIRDSYPSTEHWIIHQVWIHKTPSTSIIIKSKSALDCCERAMQLQRLLEDFAKLSAFYADTIMDFGKNNFTYLSLCSKRAVVF